MGGDVRMIDRSALRGHPANSNRMPEHMLRKLMDHLRDGRHYPAVIVRPHPCETGAFEILDGHHRVEALGRLNIEQVRCDVWPVDDARALMLLATLNRLRGDDDPVRRGALMAQLAQQHELKALAKLVPEDAREIERLIEATRPIEALAPPRCAEALPQAVTFFLTCPQRDRLLAHLREIALDRSEALVRLLALNGE